MFVAGLESLKFEQKWRNEGAKANMYIYLTIIPRARIGCENKAHEAEG